MLMHLDEIGSELDYPVVFDHEPITVSGVAGRANSVSRDDMTALDAAFCERVEAAGYDTMIYGNKNDIARYDTDLVEKSTIWFAEYGASPPSGQFDFVMWQYSNAGHVAGISTNVDMNIYFLDPNHYSRYI